MNINRITQLRRLARKNRQMFYGRLLAAAWDQGKLKEILKNLKSKEGKRR